jgi:putative transposase
MARGTRFSPERIIAKLCQIEVQLAQGKSLALACKEGGLSEQSYLRWRREYGGVAVEQAKRLKELERENARFAALFWSQSLFSRV